MNDFIGLITFNDRMTFFDVASNILKSYLPD